MNYAIPILGFIGLLMFVGLMFGWNHAINMSARSNVFKEKLAQVTADREIAIQNAREYQNYANELDKRLETARIEAARAEGRAQVQSTDKAIQPVEYPNTPTEKQKCKVRWNPEWEGDEYCPRGSRLQF